MLDVLVNKTYGSFTVRTAFIVRGAGITVLFGHSGAGKTSVINMISGLSNPDEGHILVNGRCLFDSSRGICFPPEKRNVGYVFQEGRLFPHLTVKSNLTYGMKRAATKCRPITFHQIVDMLGIGALLDRLPANLSGGEKQRVAIGRALLTSPELLLMDEPLASLDGARKAEILPFIARLPRELSIPILYVTHDLDEIWPLADTLVLLHSGETVAAGPLEKIMSEPDLIRHAGQQEAGVVITAAVESHDIPPGLTRLHFAGGILRVPVLDCPVGTTLRVRIPSRNVALALERPDQTSYLNIFPGIIEEVGDNNGSGVTLRVDIGVPVLSTVTPASKETLGLRPGMRVFALLKDVSLFAGQSGNFSPEKTPSPVNRISSD